MTDPGQPQEGAPDSPWMVGFLYLVCGPGVAWALYLLLAGLAGTGPKFPGEAMTAFYLFGAPGAALAGLAHWIMRRQPWAFGVVIVAVLAGLFGLMGGGLAVLAASAAATACFAAVRAMRL